MAGEIRAGGVSDETLKRFGELKEYLGANTHTSTMEALVNILHLQIIGSSRLSVFKKAAKLVSANENLNRELQPGEIQKVSIQRNVVHVWVRCQGPPFVISEKVWNEGIC